MNPVTRKEVFLDAICDGEPCGLEPASREELVLKKLAESMVGGGSGGGSGECDWNIMKNKPFGVDYTPVSTLDAEVYNFVPEGTEGVYKTEGSYYEIGLLFDSDDDIIIEIDGARYTGSAADLRSNNVSKGLAPADGELPVGIYPNYLGSGHYEWTVFFYGEGSTHELTFYRLEEIVKKIDEKFLPASGDLVVWFNSDEFGLITDIDPWDISNAVYSGVHVVGIHEEVDVFTHVYTVCGFDSSTGAPIFYGFADGKIMTLTYNDDGAYTKTVLS